MDNNKPPTMAFLPHKILPHKMVHKVLQLKNFAAQKYSAQNFAALNGAQNFATSQQFPQGAYRELPNFMPANGNQPGNF